MAGFPRLRFLRPPSEPDMHVAAHPALHEPRFLNRCSVHWKSSTRHSSACRYSASSPRSERPLRFAVPLRHVAGFPGLGLLRELRPTWMRPVGHGLVLRLSTRGPHLRGSHVHQAPFDGGGVQLHPCGIASGTLPFSRRPPRTHRTAGTRSGRPMRWWSSSTAPTRIRQV